MSLYLVALYELSFACVFLAHCGAAGVLYAADRLLLPVTWQEKAQEVDSVWEVLSLMVNQS